MPVRRHSIDLPAANDDRRRRSPNSDIALAEPIVEGTIVPSGVEAIIKLEDEYDRMAADASANRWQTAELYDRELDAGMTTRELGNQVSKSHMHVGRMARVWREHGGNLGFQRPFNPLYQATKAPKAVDSAPMEAAGGKFIPTPGRRPRVGSYGKPRNSTAAVGNGSGFLDRHAQPEPECTGSCLRCCG